MHAQARASGVDTESLHLWLYSGSVQEDRAVSYLRQAAQLLPNMHPRPAVRVALGCARSGIGRAWSVCRSRGALMRALTRPILITQLHLCSFLICREADHAEERRGPWLHD